MAKSNLCYLALIFAEYLIMLFRYLAGVLSGLFFISTPAFALTAEPVHIPISYLEERILLPVEIEGVGERFFILDTAAGRSVISADLRAELELTPEDISQLEVQGATGAITLEVVTLSGLSLGELPQKDVSAVVADLSSFREYDGRQVEGILGVDVLSRYDVAIDVPGATVSLLQDGTSYSELGVNETGLEFHSGVQPGFVQFNVMLEGTPVAAVLDSAARVGTINWQAASLARLFPDSDAVTIKEGGSRGIDGIGTESFTAPVSNICLGERCYLSMNVKIADLPVFSVLGIADQPAMLVGAAFMADCPMVIAYSTQTLHVCAD
ncbi:retropepsin-like aspartic protease [Pseudidiomarina terrestris]|uniref:Clan AA aspartic protease n=2 Tax=Pseudidiomarina terrestris TaxID=2820060 RepID=A0AAW7R1C2_9GAMM|nr:MULTISPECIES: retropepsin-like aspartic protease [unclassified Pseudidiomarina]MDN7125496.1 clan AA aspartic protease [Pseudidiomarina sp. 1APP75-32.1]MDN7130254.1 clan AA aspartic protease [Pseudidiomarina sp. 1APR75-15]MDN7135763.1 clan AA aspartic protease [Pseudidiomarina sp. 1ASP75-5]